MKVLYSCVLLLALFAASQATSCNIGRKNNGDILLMSERELRYPIQNNNWNVFVQYPNLGTISNYHISFVSVIDSFRNSSGAFCSILSGGPGFRFALVRLSGQQGQGLDSIVEFWGRLTATDSTL